MTEVWKLVSGFPNYKVSNLGRVQGPRRMLKPLVTRNGYLLVTLHAYHVLERFLVHRLVASAFIPNPEGLPTVNHKDGVKANCRADNLEWSTKSTQQRHALETGLRKRYGKGYRFDKTRGKWFAYGKNNGKMTNLGRFDTEAQAIEARNRFINSLTNGEIRQWQP